MFVGQEVMVKYKMLVSYRGKTFLANTASVNYKLAKLESMLTKSRTANRGRRLHSEGILLHE